MKVNPKLHILYKSYLCTYLLKCGYKGEKTTKIAGISVRDIHRISLKSK